MGVYSLARRPKVTIRSRPRPVEGARLPAWQVQLKPEHFLGEYPAAIEILDGDDLGFGTEIVFDDDKANEGHVNIAAWYFPLAVTCNDAEVKRADFLKDAVHIEKWHGIRLGVHRSRYHGGRNPEINFHGIVIENVNLPKVGCMTHDWHVQADVVDCAELELVLPGRKAVVETPFVDQLRGACRTAIYRAMLATEPAIDVSATVREDALAHGVQLPIARAELASAVETGGRQRLLHAAGEAGPRAPARRADRHRSRHAHLRPAGALASGGAWRHLAPAVCRGTALQGLSLVRQARQS